MRRLIRLHSKAALRKSAQMLASFVVVWGSEAAGMLA